MKTLGKDLRFEFKILKNNNNLVYLNSSATSLIPDSIVEFEKNLYNNIITTINRSFDYKNNTSEQFKLSLKNIANYINATYEELIPVLGTTDGINKIASTLIDELNDNDEIIIGSWEHASNILPWIEYSKARKKNIKIKWYELKDWTINLEHLKKLITNKTKIISISHQYNTTGATNDIKLIRKIIGKDVLLVVDAAQSIGHTLIDVKNMDCDFLVFSTHKVFGPNGLGFVYGKKKILENIRPFNYGGGMNKIYSKNDVEYQKLPNKFMAGTQNIPAILTFSKVIDWLNQFEINQIKEYTINLKKSAEKLLSTLSNVKIINKNVESNILFFEINGVSGEDVAYHLSKKEIIVRSGSLCVKIENNIYKKSKSIRASFHIYNTIEDVNKLFEQIKNGGDFLEALFGKRKNSQLCE